MRSLNPVKSTFKAHYFHAFYAPVDTENPRHLIHVPIYSR